MLKFLYVMWWRRYRRHVLTVEQLGYLPDLTVVEARLLLDVVERSQKLEPTAPSHLRRV